MSKAKKIQTLKLTGPIHALLYCRVSSDRQAKEGHGLDSQEQRCRDYARMKGYDVEPDGVFRDSFTGGGDFMNRPGMSALLAYLEARPFKSYVVIFDDLKRLARDTSFYLKLRKEFQARGAKVESPNFNFEETDEGYFIETVLAAQGELERKQNRRQVIQKQKARLENGYWPFGGKKGYVIEKDPRHGKLARPSKQGLEVLKPALEGFASGNLVRKIDVCRFLCEKNFWGEQHPEKYIHPLDKIMRDPFYCGDISYPAWEVSRRPGHQEPIISKETFELIQKRLRKEDSGARIRLDLSPDFPLRGLLVCSECYSHLTAAWSKGHKKLYGYYLCRNKDCRMYGKSVPKDVIEKQFKALLKKHKLRNEVEKIISAVFDFVWKEEAENLNKRETMTQSKIKDIKSKITQLTELVFKAKSEQIKHVYEDQLETFGQELEQIEQNSTSKLDLNIPYRTAKDKAIKMLKSPYVVWESLGLEDKQRLFYFIFEEKLPYSLKEGYRTDKIPSAIRLFEQFALKNTDDVEMGGVEPPCERDASNESTAVARFFVVVTMLENNAKHIVTISFIRGLS